MPTNHDSGHQANVANLEHIISFTTGYGATYNPSNNNIKIAQLQPLLMNSKSALQMMKNAETAYNNSTNAREISFAPLKKNTTRIMAALEASGAVQQTIDDARTINHKIQGTHITKQPLTQQLRRRSLPLTMHPILPLFITRQLNRVTTTRLITSESLLYYLPTNRYTPLTKLT